MGIKIGVSIDKAGYEYENKKVSKFDPDPRKFVIKLHTQVNGNLAILVNYPNCNNYEGNKIIVYKKTSYRQILKLKELDPHFTNKNNIKPFARFEPTKDGWAKALILLEII